MKIQKIDITPEKILDFEQAFLSYMRSEHGSFMSGIDESGDYSDEIVETLNQAITKFKETQTY